MQTVPPEIVLLVCPDAHNKEEAVVGLAPKRTNCPTCGKDFISRCSQCGKSFDSTDYETNFHSCGAAIPWANARNAAVEAQRQLTLERLAAKKRGEPYWTEAERRAAIQGPLRELTAAERQDLIVPPSERLPMESVRPFSGSMPPEPASRDAGNTGPGPHEDSASSGRDVLTAAQLRLLQLGFEQFCAQNTWPPIREMQLQLDRLDVEFEIEETAESLPRVFGYIANEDGRGILKLTVRGVAQCRGADDELRRFVAGVQLFASHYLSGGGTVTKREFVEALSTTNEGALKRTFLLLEQEGRFLWSGDGPEGEWKREVSPYIRPFRKVRDIRSYFDALAQTGQGRSAVVESLERAVAATAAMLGSAPEPAANEPTTHERMQAADVFIAHASEDKGAVARPLALALEARGLKIWFDEFAISVGDGLRRTIDRGLAVSRFGVVILSPDFFEKEWPQKELDGLAARESGGQKVILPIWHNLTFAEVLARSPTLADRYALRSSAGVEKMADELEQVIKPAASKSARARRSTTPSPQLEIVFKPTENAYAQAYWADGPHRLFGWWYRVGVTNRGERSIEGVRLLLKDVRGQPYKPMYLRVEGDRPPFTRSLEGVRLDPRSTALFDVCFRNHESRDEIQFHYASEHDPNLRPAGAYVLVLEAQARDVRPVLAEFECYLESEELRFKRRATRRRSTGSKKKQEQRG